MNGRRATSREVTEWSKLKRKRSRERSGRFLAEGERCVEQILANGLIAVEALLVSDSAGWAPPPGYEPVQLTQAELNRITDTENPQGVAAVCRTPDPTGLEELAETEGVLVAMDGVQDPGNVGTIVRSAVWFGAGGLLCGKGSADLYHPKVVRSTVGATGSLPSLSGNLEAILERLEKAGWQVLLLDAGEGAVPISRPEPAAGSRMVVVVGNEGGGISERLKKPGRSRVMIPALSEQVESLNAAVALSIALYTLSG